MSPMKFLLPILLTALLPTSGIAEDYNSCFVPGEVSEYKVSWMGIPLAWSRTTTERVMEDGREVIRILMVSKSYKAFTKIYKVDDRKEVTLDPKTALPLRIDLQMNEGSIHTSQQTWFDHANHTAHFHDRIANTTNQIEIASQTRDVVTFLFSMRHEDPATLSDKEYSLFSGGKLYSIKLKTRKQDRMKLPGYGKVECIPVEPVAEFDGLFLRKGKITFWVSNQNRRMITCIKAKIPVGKIMVKLQNVSGPGDDFWVMKE